MRGRCRVMLRVVTIILVNVWVWFGRRALGHLGVAKKCFTQRFLDGAYCR